MPKRRAQDPSALRLARRLVEPRHLWIRHRPIAWPGRDALWCDPATGRLGRRRDGARLPAGWEAAAPPDDVVHLPPVPPRHEAARRRLGAELAGAGVPVLLHLLPGEPPPEGGRGIALYDVAAAVAAADHAALAGLPAGSLVLWPLIAGATDAPERLDSGLTALAAAGVRRVVPIAPALTPAERRRLAREGGEALFQALFHGRPVAVRAFARRVAERGMSPWLDRPLPRAPGLAAGNRRLAGCLAAAAELWLELGRAEARGQELWAAARRIDRQPHDLEALWREGNLGVVGWLDQEMRAVAAELFGGGESTLLAELRREYLQPA